MLRMVPLPMELRSTGRTEYLRQRKEQQEAVEGQQRSGDAEDQRHQQDPTVGREEGDRAEDEGELERHLGEVEIIVPGRGDVIGILVGLSAGLELLLAFALQRISRRLGIRFVVV